MIKTSTGRTTPKTLAAFRKRAERMANAANPTSTLTFEWTHSAAVVWADGSRGFSGVVQVRAPGYRTRSMVASLSHHAMMVR